MVFFQATFPFQLLQEQLSLWRFSGSCPQVFIWALVDIGGRADAKYYTCMGSSSNCSKRFLRAFLQASVSVRPQPVALVEGRDQVASKHLQLISLRYLWQLSRCAATKSRNSLINCESSSPCRTDLALIQLVVRGIFETIDQKQSHKLIIRNCSNLHLQQTRNQLEIQTATVLRIILFVVSCIDFVIMPVREGRAKLWFKTKEEQDEYDDLVISNIELTSDVESDDNYCLMFNRMKKEQFLTLNSRAQNQISQVASIYKGDAAYIDKYLAGKRDHSKDRYWNIQKGMLGWGVGYLLLRELPIRNFYARSWIMFYFLCIFAERKGTWNPLYAFNQVLEDEFTDKDIRNYQAYHDMTHPILPHASNKIPESKVWQMNQPAYMREAPEAKLSELTWMLFPPTPKTVAWDGTFNMPLEGLAHPLHRDGKFVDFAWWEY